MVPLNDDQMCRATDHIADRLFAALPSVSPYPPGVAPIPKLIDGLGFFPAGRGVWHRDPLVSPPPVPVGRVMVLGNNFGTEDYYAEAAVRQESPSNTTWRPLLATLHDAGVLASDCFFTNAFIGLIVGKSMTEQFPGLRDNAFVARCKQFLMEQMLLVQPRVLVVLGKEPARLVAELSPDLRPWRTDFKFKVLDEAGFGLIRSAAFSFLSHQVNCVVLVHPCYPVNTRLRRFAGFQKREAEVEMLRAAVSESHL